MRDLRIFRIFEGTNDILRLFVSLTGLQVITQLFYFLEDKSWVDKIIVKKKPY